MTPHSVAQDKPIRIVVGFPPGGGLDSVARALAPGLSRRLQAPVIVENKPGGNSIAATSYVASAPPDGRTIYLATTTPYSMLPYMQRAKLPYDPQAFTSIALVAETPLAFGVAASSKLKSFQEFLGAARAAADKKANLTYSTSGLGQVPSLAMELFKSEQHIDLLHIPYQGGAPAGQAAAAGEVDVVVMSPAALVPLVDAGRLRLLAITGSQRLPALANVPTLSELGISFSLPPIWYGFVGPAGVPSATVAKLNEAINAEMASPEMERLLRALSLLRMSGEPANVEKHVAADHKIWGPLITKSGYKVD